MRSLRFAILVIVAALVACDDPFGPRFWSDEPETVLLYSSSRPELVGRPSAFDFVELQGLPIEIPGLTGNWDIALADEDGGLALVPAGAFEGITSRAAIAVVPNATLEDVTVAPRDTAEFRGSTVVVDPTSVYVIRTRRASCGFGTTGFRYAKLRALAIDVERGTLTFEVVRNPFCNDRSFIPPES